VEPVFVADGIQQHNDNESSALPTALWSVIAPLVDELVATKLAELRKPRENALEQKEMAAALGVSVKTLLKMVDQGMPFMLVGDYKRFERERVLAWLHEHARGVA